MILFTLSCAFFLQGCKEDKLDDFATGILDGTVMDFTSEVNLSGAILTTNPPTVSVASDSVGYFIFKTIDVGDYNLIAKKNGYVSESVAVSVQQNKTTTVVVLMERSSEYNNPPEFTGSFTPGNGETNQEVNLTLSWGVTDSNEEDSLTFDVELYESNHENAQYFEGLTDTTVNVVNLSFNTVYYWQVTANDPYSFVKSELLTFRTIPLPDNEFMFARMTMEGDYEIFSCDSLENNLVQLTINHPDDWQPRLSPLRNLVAYVSHTNLEHHIFTMERDGSRQTKISKRPITGYNNPGLGLAWSPTGDQIIYSNYDRLSFIQYDGTIEGVITIAPANRHFKDLDWSPDGTLIVAQTSGVNPNDNEIYLMNADGTNPVILVNNLPGIIEAPSFSVDGKQVIYTRDLSGSTSGTNRQLDAHIFIINIASGISTDVSQEKPNGTNDTNPRFSPNGAHIIFESASNVSGSEKSIWVMDADGENRKLLFSNAEMPDWR
ncbi:MAG: PD40 domain-containing protein [Bacteroidales bacterium]|nr:PD40 domain-containing protein [Bacteroidales bacterium]